MTSNSLMKPAVGSQMATFDAGSNPFLNRAKAENVTDGTYLRFNGNEGRYISNDTEVEVDSELICDLYNCRLGWQGFDNDNKPYRGDEVSLISGAELPEPDRTNEDVRWSKVVKFAVMTVDGKDLLYTSKADKPTREVWKLIKKYGAEMMRNVDEHNRYKVPVVKFSARSFQINVDVEENGKTRKVKTTKYAEAFTIVGWLSQDEVAALVIGEAPAEPDEAQGTQEIIPPAPKPAAMPEQKKPTAGMPFTRGRA